MTALSLGAALKKKRFSRFQKYTQKSRISHSNRKRFIMVLQQKKTGHRLIFAESALSSQIKIETEDIF